MKKILFFLAALVFSLIFSSKAYAYDFKSPPNRIIIPAIGVNLPVTTAKIAFTTWEVSLTGASFGDSTALPGNRGNTVIFAHARFGLFLDLPKIKTGDLVHVFTPTDWFVYQVTQTMVVGPEDTEVINPSKNYDLTLYTCTGPDWGQRFIAKARLLTVLPPETN